MLLNKIENEEKDAGFERFLGFLKNIESKEYKKVSIYNQHSEVTAVDSPDKGELAICLFSVPSEIVSQFAEGQIETISPEEGVSLNVDECQSDAYVYFGKSPLVDYEMILDKKGQTIALLANNILWIVFDLVHSPNNLEEITNYILGQAFGLKGKELSPVEKEKRERELLLSLYKKFILQEGNNLKRNLSTLMSSITSYENSLATSIRDYVHQKHELELLETDLETKCKQVYSVIDNIRANSKVDKVRMSGGYLVTDTKDLYLGELKIGKYRIVFNENTFPKVTYLSRVVSSSHQHPHSLDNGELCFGGFKNVNELYWMGRWDELLTTILCVLESYDSESCYSHLEVWVSSWKDLAGELDRITKGKKVWKIIGGQMKYRDKP